MRLRETAVAREWRARVMLGLGNADGEHGGAGDVDVSALSARRLEWGDLNKHFSRQVKQRLRKLRYARRRYYNLGLNDERIRERFVAKGDAYARLYERLRAEVNEYYRVYRGEAKRVKGVAAGRSGSGRQEKKWRRRRRWRHGRCWQSWPP
jgi:hypothetical protein